MGIEPPGKALDSFSTASCVELHRPFSSAEAEREGELNFERRESEICLPFIDY